MEWACAECGRTYHEPPESCPICGHDVLVPTDERERDRVDSFLVRLRSGFTDSATVGRGLLDDSPLVTALFWFLMVLSAFLALVVVLSLLP